MDLGSLSLANLTWQCHHHLSHSEITNTASAQAANTKILQMFVKIKPLQAWYFTEATKNWNFLPRLLSIEFLARTVIKFPFFESPCFTIRINTQNEMKFGPVLWNSCSCPLVKVTYSLKLIIKKFHHKVEGCSIFFCHYY